MHLSRKPLRYFQGDPWTIVEEGFDPGRQRVSESVFSVVAFLREHDSVLVAITLFVLAVLLFSVFWLGVR